MRSSSVARVKSYIVLMGLERSLAENIVRNFDLSGRAFLKEEEQSKAFSRLLEDQGIPSLKLEDVDVEDLLPYLDLGDLVSVLNRHASSAKNLVPEHIRKATEVIEKLGALTIRKRVMHPVRPLEVDDLPNLLKLADEIQRAAPSLFWDLLAINMRRLAREDAAIDVAIPSYWAEESPVIHNLPPAEFDDTGFIGRSKERRELRKWLESEPRVVTVVGGAGVGKTALALRVCNDFLEDSKPVFDRLVWVSLKTKYLTPEGVRQIHDSIDSLDALVDDILRSLKISAQARWAGVLEHLRISRTLLVIDNLETIGEEIRDLLVNIPAKSKVLLTSRVGLGEIEVRYELSGFSSKDAITFFRSLVAIYNCSPFKNLSQNKIDHFITVLGKNPLLIKWFILAVCRGHDPETLLTKEALDEPLNFFYSKIYDKLDPLAKQILSVLLASRRELTKTQLQELTNSQHIPFSRAIQNLVRSSMVERVSLADGTMVFQVGQLVYDYISRNHSPSDELVKSVRERLRGWQLEQDRSMVQTARYRYGPSVLHIKKTDERISAPHLLRALKAIGSRDFQTASDAVSTAEQLTPTWCEVYRVKARLLEAQNKWTQRLETEPFAARKLSHFLKSGSLLGNQWAPEERNAANGQSLRHPPQSDGGGKEYPICCPGAGRQPQYGSPVPQAV